MAPAMALEAAPKSTTEDGVTATCAIVVMGVINLLRVDHNRCFWDRKFLNVLPVASI